MTEKTKTRGNTPNRLGRKFFEASLPAPMIARIRKRAKKARVPLGHVLEALIEAGEVAERKAADA